VISGLRSMQVPVEGIARGSCASSLIRRVCGACFCPAKHTSYSIPLQLICFSFSNQQSRGVNYYVVSYSPGHYRSTASTRTRVVDPSSGPSTVASNLTGCWPRNWASWFLSLKKQWTSQPITVPAVLLTLRFGPMSV